MWSSLVGSVKSEYNAIRIWPRGDVSSKEDLERAYIPTSAYQEQRRHYTRLKPSHLGPDRSYNLRISTRTLLERDKVTLHGWPSRGGIIVLEHAAPPDFDFLHLDALDPPLRRDPDQAAEDIFCQGLLRLGATWWDSEKRCHFVSSLEHQIDEAMEALEADEDLRPTRRERGWVCVAWPSEPAGALCVLACEKVIVGRYGDEKMVPKHAGLVSLARDMDERCRVLQRLGGVMYGNIEEFNDDGSMTFLKAWEDDHKGEKGPLVWKDFIDPQRYGGVPDEALGKVFPSRSDDHQ